ncbi:MAG: crotonase/enoyl-CoA hydratase family protein [Rubrivivax sp.]|nr:crotonase/enoyl-CoA hydratase family protein [Rubrivivax sp.]
MTQVIDPARVHLGIGADGVAQVALVRSDRMNALDAAMFASIAAAMDRLRTEPTVRAVVLHGEGRAFCSGLDKAFFGDMAGGRSLGALGEIIGRTHGDANAIQWLAWGWRQLAVSVIAAVHGPAFGGGLQLALGADMRIVHPEAQMSFLEIKWGLVPDMAGCVLLTELVRADIARELVLTGRVVDGREAVQIGLATRVADDPLAEALQLARQMAGCSPDAIRAAKRLLNAASPVDAARVLMAESYEQQRLIESTNQVEAVRAALEQRRPVFV